MKHCTQAGLRPHGGERRGGKTHNIHKRASHEAASLATAALTDVQIVSAFCSRQTCYKTYSVASDSLKTCSLEQYGWKIFSWKRGGVQDMSRTGLHRAMFMFLIQWLTHYFTLHENHSYPNSFLGFFFFCLSGALTLLVNVFSRHQKWWTRVLLREWNAMLRTRKLIKQCHFITASVLRMYISSPSTDLSAC